MSNEEVCIGVEVSSSAMRAVSVTGNSVGRSATAPIAYSSSVVEQLTAFIERCRTEFGNASKIGVAVPALVGPGRRVVEYSTHIAEFSGLDLASGLGDKDGGRISVFNDANAAAWAEYQIGAGRAVAGRSLQRTRIGINHVDVAEFFRHVGVAEQLVHVAGRQGDDAQADDQDDDEFDGGKAALLLARRADFLDGVFHGFFLIELNEK